MKNHASFLLCFIIALCLSHSALSQDHSNLDTSLQIENLKKRLTILEKQLKEDKTSKPDDVIITLRPSPSFKTADGKTSFSLNGRMMFDAGIVTKDKTSSLNNDISIRRLWLGANGHINEDWSYQTLIGFENNQTTVADAFIRYSGLHNTDILIGSFFENNGIDIGTPNLINPLMERSSGITTFRKLRRTGASFNSFGDNWGAHFGVFGSDTSNSSSRNEKGTGFSGRAHYAVINNKADSHFLHLGFNATYRTPDSATRTMRFKSTGNANVINGILIDTGDITQVDNYYQNMAEFRYQKGSLNITSEYLRTHLNRSGLKNLEFNGGYVMATYFLTGEKYGYDTHTGVPLAANFSKGTWEIATRYSITDLNNKDIKGGKMHGYDFGINYYTHKHFKFMANYIINKIDNATSLQKQNPHYFLVRAQIDF